MRNVTNSIRANLKKNIYNIEIFGKLGFVIFNYLEYTVEELIKHIESLWEPWMNWENYGKYSKNKMTWQIDHIIPQSKLKFINFDDENFKKLWILSNLRPLETIANIRKGNKLIDVNTNDLQISI